MHPSDPDTPAAGEPVYEPAALSDPAAKKPRPRPPVGRRWQPGESGNPAGRPRRKTLPSAPAALERALKGRVTVQTGGRVRRMGVAEAVIERLIDQAIAGDTAARRDLLKAQAELEEIRAERREAARLRREARERAARQAEAAARSAEPQPAHACGAVLRRALAALGAGTEHFTWHAYGGRKHEANVTLAAWVVEAAFARDPDLEGRLNLEQCQAVLRAMTADYSGMYERYGDSHAPKEPIEASAVMERLLARVREGWRASGQLFVDPDGNLPKLLQN